MKLWVMRSHGVRDTLGAGSDQLPDHLFGGNRWQAEGQAGRHLDRAAHAHAASAVFVLQVVVDAFGNSFATIPAPVGRMPHFRPVLWTASNYWDCRVLPQRQRLGPPKIDNE